MTINIICILFGAVASTIGWYFVIRNNRKKFDKFMGDSESYVVDALRKTEGISDDVITKVTAIFKKMKG